VSDRKERVPEETKEPTMKRTILIALAAAATVACGAGRAVTTEIDYPAFSKAMGNFYLTTELGTPGKPDYRFFYADRAGHVHTYVPKDGSFVRDWEVTSLGSHATSLIVTDLYGDGKQKLALTTISGRFMIYDVATYQLEWENLQLRLTRVDHMAVANLDNDPQTEAVVLADDLMYIFDSYNRVVQWSSTTKVFAKFIVIGNVDDDPQLEIVLNNGQIFDGRFYNIQFQTDQPFGDRLMLADMTGDGYDDVVGEFPDRTLRIFDVWRGREVW
jgi:hypothetical protein